MQRDHSLTDFLFTNSPVPLWIFDFTALLEVDTPKTDVQPSLEEFLQGAVLVDANRAVFELYEAQNLAVLRENLPAIIPDGSYENIRRATEHLRNKHGVYEFESENYTLSGRRIDVLIRFTPLDSGENHGRVLLSTMDITHYKDLLRENALLVRLPEANPDVVLIMDCEGHIRNINPAGRTAIDSMNTREGVFSLLPENYTGNVCRFCDRKSSRQQRYSRNDREYIMKVSPFAGENRCMVVVSDTTDLVRLKEEKELYSAAVQAVGQPVMITDSGGRIVSVNRAFTGMYGYEEQEVLGKNPRILNPGRRIYQDLGHGEAEYTAQFAELWESISNPAVGTWQGTVINRRKDGKILWVRLIISAVLCENNIITNYIAMPVDITSTIDESNVSKMELYQAIADLAEMRDNETGNHMRRVGLFSRLLAQELGKADKYCKDLEVFSPLHDIGKVGIQDSLLLAPRKLTDEEFETMKSHTVIGYRIVKDKHDMEMAADIILNHHEWYNGAGYPYGMAGKDIPLSARITAVSDIYDALRSRRPYKEPWTHADAAAEIISKAGTHLDPEVVEVFQRTGSRFDAIYSNLKD